MCNKKVLVIGNNDLASLQIVRSLGRLGLTIHVVGFHASQITRRSRYVHRFFQVQKPLIDICLFGDFLERICTEYQYDLIVPSCDSSTLALSLLHERLERIIVPNGTQTQNIIAVPDFSTFSFAYDKAKCCQLAQKLSIPIPETTVIKQGDFEGLQQWVNNNPIIDSIVLKPAISVCVGQVSRWNVEIAQSEAQVIASGSQLLHHCDVLLQSFFHGKQFGLGVVATKGVIHGAFQQRQLHEINGFSTYRESLPVNQQMFEDAKRFCEETQWTGPALFEYLVADDNNDRILLEVNGRFWASLSLAVAAGVDMPKILYQAMQACDSIQNESPVLSYRIPFYSRHCTRDFFWWVHTLRSQKLTKSVPYLIRSFMGEACHIIRGRERWDVESLTDPVPGVVAMLEWIRELVTGIWSRMVKFFFKTKKVCTMEQNQNKKTKEEIRQQYRKERFDSQGYIKTFTYFLGTHVLPKYGIEKKIIYQWGDEKPQCFLDETLEFVVATRPDDISEKDRQAIIDYDGLPYFERFLRSFEKSKCFMVRKDGNLACYGWCEKITEGKLLSSFRPTFLIRSCVTMPQYRGQGLHPIMLQHGIASCENARILIMSHFTNHSSIRGIQKVGFKRIGCVYRIGKIKCTFVKPDCTKSG